MFRSGTAALLSGVLFSLAASAQPGPGLFGDRRWRAPVALVGDLPASASWGTVQNVAGALYWWDGDSWEPVGGAGSGEANTASNLGGGLANFSAKVGVDLRFNSLAAVDFDLSANVLSIDDTKWAKDSEIQADTNAGTICAGTTTYLDGEGACDDLSLVYSVLAHGHVLSALSGAVTDAQVPNNITVDLATAAGGAPPTGSAGGDLGGLYPDPSVDDDGHAHTAATLPAASTTAAGLVELATDGEAASGLAVQGNDSRLSNARTPTAHASSHANGGSDEVSVAGLSGLLADGQTPLSHAASHQDGGGDEVSVAALSGQLADAQKVTVRKNSGADVGSRSRLNLIEGSGVTLTVADDGAGGEVDVTVAASGGSGIGGTVGATSDAIPVADGTGGSTLKASTVKITSGALIVPDGSDAATGIRFASHAAGTGLYGSGATGISFAQNGGIKWTISNSSIANQTGGAMRNAGAGEPIFAPVANYGLGYSSSTAATMYVAGFAAQEWTRPTGGVYRSTVLGQAVDLPQAVTCADDGTGAAAALTVAATGAAIYITNSDANGCVVTMGETNVTSGQRAELVVVSSVGGTVDFADSAGVTELAGAFAAGLYDSLALRYIADRWIETGRSDN